MPGSFRPQPRSIGRTLLVAAALSATVCTPAGGAAVNATPPPAAGNTPPVRNPTRTPGARSGTGNETIPLIILGGLLGEVLTHRKRPAAKTTAIPRAQAVEQGYPVAIVGTVSDDLDQPVPGAGIELAGESRRRPVSRVAQSPTSGPYSEELAYVEADRNGRYAIAEQLREGTYRLSVSAFGTGIERVSFSVSAAGRVVQNFVLRRSAAEEPAVYATRGVYYVTERKPSPARGGVTFGSAVAPRRELTYGSVEVSVPQSAGLPVPRGSQIRHLTDPGRHVVVATPVPSSSAQLSFAALRAEQRASASGAVLLFVHGYNQTFEQAVRTAAQLRAGLGIDAPAVVYDWPSQGDLSGYLYDEDQVRTSATRFVPFVERLARELPGARIEIVAHSMGNRLVTDLIEGGAGAPSGTRTRLDHVVMAAPDVFTSQFTSRLTFIPATAGRISIYASRSDQALLMSSIAHQGPRLGYFVKYPIAIHGMETIDATAVDTSILGHGYFVDERSVVSDMRGALADHSPRAGLQRIPIDDRYWYWRLTSPN